MWSAVRNVLGTFKEYLFPRKRKVEQRVVQIDDDLDEPKSKRARMPLSAEMSNDLMSREPGCFNVVKGNSCGDSPDVSSNSLHNISDDESDVEHAETDWRSAETLKHKDKVIDLEARDRYSTLLQQWTPTYMRRVSGSVDRSRSESHRRRLRSILFCESSQLTSPGHAPLHGSHVQQRMYEQTMTRLGEMACTSTGTRIFREKLPDSSEQSYGVSPTKMVSGYVPRQNSDDGSSDDTSSIGSSPTYEKFPGHLDISHADNHPESLSPSRMQEQEVVLSSECVSVAETSSSDASASHVGSQSTCLRRCTSLEQLDNLCTRSPFSELNGKFQLWDPTSLRLKLSRVTAAKVQRNDLISKLEIEAQLRRDARLAIQKPVEDEVRLRMRLEGLLLEEREISTAVEFLELTDEQQKYMSKAVGPGKFDEVIVEGFNQKITRRDLQTLCGLNWLNDEVINFFFDLIKERGGKEGLPKIYAMSTFFYPKLMQGGHASLKRWTKKVDIFSYDLIFVPVHLDIHWCLAVIDLRKKSISYFDSMSGANDSGLRALLQYLQAESLDKKKVKLDVSDWKLIRATDIPTQKNGSDCGMFACRFAEYISRDARITFTQEHMPYFRRRMIYEIITKRLL